jgi:hypothetical protein
MTEHRWTSYGESHENVPLAFGVPAPHAWEVTPPSARGEDSELEAEQCILHRKYFFVRGHLDLPIHDSDEVLRWVVWLSVRQKDFMRMTERAGESDDPPFTGWLDTVIPGYPSTLGLEVKIQTKPGTRPKARLTVTEHPLFAEQRDGLNWEQVHAHVADVVPNAR